MKKKKIRTTMLSKLNQTGEAQTILKDIVAKMAKDANVKTSDKDLKDSLEFFTTTSEEQAKAAEEEAKKSRRKKLLRKNLATKQKIQIKNLNNSDDVLFHLKSDILKKKGASHNTDAPFLFCYFTLNWLISACKSFDIV
ncbi:hypothetical protein OL548_33105 [Lysinibacillus sp. MHQ-1]|nr:hypothetical protein OL548_33105 [Lysinibacillus sp. MHQ-1]